MTREEFREQLAKAVVQHYGEENTDCIGDTFTIYFPTIHISNEQGQSTFIKELYFTFFFYTESNGRYRLNSYFRLFRGSYTSAQRSNNYVFSHVQGMNPRQATTFTSSVCFGTTNFASMISRLQNGEHKDSISDSHLMTAKSFAFTIKNYLSHESTSGGPYRTFPLPSRGRTSITSFLSRNTDNNTAYNIYVPQGKFHEYTQRLLSDGCKAITTKSDYHLKAPCYDHEGELYKIKKDALKNNKFDEKLVETVILDTPVTFKNRSITDVKIYEEYAENITGLAMNLTHNAYTLRTAAEVEKVFKEALSNTCKDFFERIYNEN